MNDVYKFRGELPLDPDEETGNGLFENDRHPGFAESPREVLAELDRRTAGQTEDTLAMATISPELKAKLSALAAPACSATRSSGEVPH